MRIAGGALAITHLFCTSALAVEIRLRPVSASKPHYFDGEEMVLLEPGGTVTLEAYVSGWDPDGDGDPLLRGYEAAIDSDSFGSGSTGTIGLTRVPCRNDNECVPEQCTSAALCDVYTAGWFETGRADFIFHELDFLDLRYGGWNVGLVAIVWNNWESVADTNDVRYLGSVKLEVSPDALGLFQIQFRATYPNQTIVIDVQTSEIPITGLYPARIRVVRDCNQNSTDDAADIVSATSLDCNANAVPDECDPDCNANGIPDDCDLATVNSHDSGGNGIPDECEPDCNANGLPDDADILMGTSEDCNENAIPDECESGGTADCNGDGTSDLCELFLATSLDCNDNGIPDTCDIADIMSRDCTGNGIPDECEPDCNRNGSADTCDLQDGISIDANTDGVPDECIQGIWLTPIGADVPHIISGNEITIKRGGATVSLELRIAGWGRGASQTYRLKSYEAYISDESLSGENGVRLDLATIPCSGDFDCPYFTSCRENGLCDSYAAFYHDPLHPNSLFPGMPSITLAQHLANQSMSISGGTLRPGVLDRGTDRHAGTLLLHVPAEATGTFVLQFGDLVGWVSHDGPLPGIDSSPVYITVAPPCDQSAVLLSTGARAVHNSIAAMPPSECTHSVPQVIASGSRSLLVLPGTGTAPHAMELTSAQLPCVRSYLVPDSSGAATLSDSPVYLTPDEWGAVQVSGAEILPGITYQVRGLLQSDQRTWASSDTTWRWGDTDGNRRVDVIDLAEVVDVLKSPAPTAEMISRANHWDCDGSSVINVKDIGAAANAVKEMSYPCPVPCSGR